jgi:hypothetical protein
MNDFRSTRPRARRLDRMERAQARAMLQRGVRPEIIACAFQTSFWSILRLERDLLDVHAAKVVRAAERDGLAA